MKKLKEYESDLEECKNKIDALLKEYNAKIEHCLDMGRVLLVDNDTQKFEFID